MLSNHPHSASSSSHHQKKDKTKKGPAANPSKSTSPHSQPIFNPTFLFVVNELEIKRADLDAEAVTGNEFLQSHHIIGENAGQVFRCNNGRIIPATDYVWFRSAWGVPGVIGHQVMDQYNQPVFDQTTGVPVMDYLTAGYQTYTVCDSWRFASRVFSYNDASVDGDGPSWQTLHFEACSIQNLSIATHGGQRFTIARDPSWKVIPQTFNNTYTNDRSAGLSGDLALILGLLALTQPPGYTDLPFQSLWVGPGQPYTGGQCVDLHPDYTPRAVLVHVAYDPASPETSTSGYLKCLETSTILVAPSPSQPSSSHRSR